MSSFQPAYPMFRKSLKIFTQINQFFICTFTGTQYRHGIYYHNEGQEKVAKKVLEEAQAQFSKPIVTECLPATVYWPAEEYHQKYLEKGGRFSAGQSAAKGCTDPIRCYG